MSSNKRKKAREWMRAKTQEVRNLETRLEEERRRATEASRARTVFPERLQTYEEPNGRYVDGFVRFPPGSERVCRVPVMSTPSFSPHALARISSRMTEMRFMSVEHAVTMRVDGEEHRVRWWNWELVERGEKVEQTISHAAHHLRLALHEYMLTTTQAGLKEESPIITAVRNALDEMSLLNGNQIERMNHRVLEQRTLSGMNRCRGYRFGGG